MANWKKYTSPHTPKNIGYVNMDLIAEILIYHEHDANYKPSGETYTRLFTGNLAVACDSMGGTVREQYFIEAKEPMEYFLGQPSRDIVG